jgi:uncharacterized glyoxalase superfamily protein PhnB
MSVATNANSDAEVYAVIAKYSKATVEAQMEPKETPWARLGLRLFGVA